MIGLKKNQKVNYRLQKVKLDWYEIEMAKFVANSRISHSREMNLKERFHDSNMTDEKNLEINTLGALGEIAVAKYLNQYFGGTVNTFKGVSDVGLNVEVRATTLKNKDLIIRDNDTKNAYYFLVQQVHENLYKIQGFLYGMDAVQDKYCKAPNPNRPRAFFVPQSDLIKANKENLQKAGLVL